MSLLNRLRNSWVPGQASSDCWSPMGAVSQEYPKVVSQDSYLAPFLCLYCPRYRGRLTCMTGRMSRHGGGHGRMMAMVVPVLFSAFLSFSVSKLPSNSFNCFCGSGDPSSSEIGRLSHRIQKEQEVQVQRQHLFKPLPPLPMSVTVQPLAFLPTGSHLCHPI